jgi:excinuclease ABC subunit B
MNNKPKTNSFVLKAPFTSTGDQPEAISGLVANIRAGVRDQVLLGVTGSGKTFTLANVIREIQKPTLIISHNKTLAAQLYQEFRDFFPDNAVSYFVSYYDYYQPEAYIPQTDTYIEKETQINEEIDKLRLAATMNLLTRKDTIIVASVSCIYNIGSPKEYGNYIIELATGMKTTREQIIERLVQLQYERNDYGFTRSTFRIRGEAIDVFPAYSDTSVRITTSDNGITELEEIHPLTGKRTRLLDAVVIYPAKHYMTDPKTYTSVFRTIENDMKKQVELFRSEHKLIEAQRIEQKVTYDLEMIRELGYVNGIENYSRYFDGRKPGDPPYSLLNYYEEIAGNDWLLCIDESHMTVPQIRGMYNGDRSRKQTLIDFGFRLPAALDNRPLRFDEFLRKTPYTIYLSATPDEWELSRAGKKHVVEQLIRPTGLLDPKISIRPVKGQIDDLKNEIQKRVRDHERVLVTTLTKQMAEDLSQYLAADGIRVHFLHSGVETFERTDILSDLRSGTYDVVVGVNLLREGLDLPEVSLVAVLDADKEGFLRSKTSLIQTMGRAARHISGEVILYADKVTDSMRFASEEVERRRNVQYQYNITHNITPVSIHKPLRERLVEKKQEEQTKTAQELLASDETTLSSMTPKEKKLHINKLTRVMREAARDLNFELAATIRDRITELDTQSSA